MESQNKKQNRLQHASSPYLLAHADNPVDWFEWGDEAFEKARTEDKPIFLSIGYNACHWCHVMEHESFENEYTATILNQYFISIKVDREERPDIDQIYMSAVTAMTGSGGWPMSVFMTYDKKPFFAGTYFPPQSAYGRPGFNELLTQIAEVYKTRRDDVFASSEKITEQIASRVNLTAAPRAIDRDVIISAARAVYGQVDHRFGGFGSAPKFPHSGNISLLFRGYHLTGDEKLAEAAYLTLHKMAKGGIYDQLGGGFHRYSVDEQWLVPHFEKMLYDNALMVVPYLEAYQISGNRDFLDIATGVLDYLQKQMTNPDGGIFATQDADSEGEEGKYYVWTKGEIESILGEDADWFCRFFGVTDRGNFEHGTSILHRGTHSYEVQKQLELDDAAMSDKVREASDKLLTARSRRVPPSTDDKILASWNGLAVSAFAQAYQVTGNEKYLQIAIRAAEYVLKNMYINDALYHSYRDGRLLKTELLEDYAYFTAGLIDLYQASFKEEYLRRAEALSLRAIELFYADKQFYLAPVDDKELIYRPQDATDGATPSPGGVMIYNLLRLAAITEKETITSVGQEALEATSGLAARIPQATATILAAGHFTLDGPIEIVVTGKDSGNLREMNRELFSTYIPNRIIVGNINGKNSDLPLLQGRQDVEQLTYFFCRDKACRLPVTDVKGLKNELAHLLETR
ncbi:MAG: thioredoxin domain-containing protein [Candidatus Zixiibacteriota bacterium]